ncbi:uncharacterized protein LOC128855690 [Anastrepha ludens]|uniref:uncharacterized protein LOC128855690 n=1 Tax=Anastrepha ludens TaxID=28586 RepID=UPI0023B02DA6|nr:uncharacterized protein LOC128855690 [Anastrepha ludens]
MGAKQTKIEGTYLPETPTVPVDKCCIPNAIDEANSSGKNNCLQDPRSPNICRTPISVYSATYQCVDAQKNAGDDNAESTLGQLRKRFFKGFTYNFNDPRSPGYQFSRTPISFNDSQDKILDLDDTFADLFADTRAQAVVPEEDKSEQDMEVHMTKNTDTTNIEIPKDESEVMINEVNESSVCLKENSISVSEIEVLPPFTPNVLCVQDEIDPRSPTIGVDRTPILFNDDEDETKESVLLECILATLSLDVSDSSICSIGSNANSPQQRGEANKIDRQGQLFRKITHKRMRQTHAKDKTPLGTRRLSTDVQNSSLRVFESGENIDPNFNIGSSFKSKQKDVLDNNIKRTPLSCIKNKENWHSRHVERSTNSLKTRLEHVNDDSFTIKSIKSNNENIEN